MYQVYPWHKVLLRRIAVILVIFFTLPVMAFWQDRARFYSYLHRIWLKTSKKPVWLQQSEMAGEYFY